MTKYITNAFSLGMVPSACRLRVEPVGKVCGNCGAIEGRGDGRCPVGDNRHHLVPAVPADAVSAVGHEATAQALSKLLGQEVAFRRVAISLAMGDEVYVAQLLGPDGKPFRLPEGKILEEEDLKGLRLEFRRVVVE